MTPEIKQDIFDFIYANLPKEFENKVYWANERKDEPEKPFCLLRAIVPEQEDFRTAEQELAGNVNKITMYKNCVVTISIFVDGTTEDVDLDIQNAFAQNTARNLKNLFEIMDTAWTFDVEGLSINRISMLRDLTTPTSGGYIYRYEFDVTFGYDEVLEIQKLIGKDVNLQIERKLND
jgi:hypothetical protein